VYSLLNLKKKKKKIYSFFFFFLKGKINSKCIKKKKLIGNIPKMLDFSWTKKKKNTSSLSIYIYRIIRDENIKKYI